EGAFPDTFTAGNKVSALILGAVARVEIVALSQGNGRRPQEPRLQPVDRTGGITEHAIDAHAVLLVLCQLFRRLQVFPRVYRFLFLWDEPGFDFLELVQEIVEVDYQVAKDRKIGQRLNTDGIGIVILEKGGAGKFRIAIDHHSATAAYTHAARPAER